MTRSTQSRSTKRHPDRKPLTREMLLPLPATEARRIALENHLALVTMRVGHGNKDLISYLLRAVYLACFLHEAAHGRAELDYFRKAESVLTQSIQRAERKEGWSLPDADGVVLEKILTLHDRQLATTPAHLISAAHARLRQFMAGGQLSPIAAAHTL